MLISILIAGGVLITIIMLIYLLAIQNRRCEQLERELQMYKELSSRKGAH